MNELFYKFSADTTGFHWYLNLTEIREYILHVDTIDYTKHNASVKCDCFKCDATPVEHLYTWWNCWDEYINNLTIVFF